MKIAYLDTSALLRILLDERDQLEEFTSWSALYSSQLMRTEALRTLHRLLMEGGLTETNFTEAYQRLLFFLQGIHLIALNDKILLHAEKPLSTILGTLDAIHLSSALLLREELNTETIAFLTHDKQLARACTIHGFQVYG